MAFDIMSVAVWFHIVAIAVPNLRQRGFEVAIMRNKGNIKWLY